MEGQTPYELVMGETPDISSLMDYDFYQPVWYYNEMPRYAEAKRHMVRWLGEAKNSGQTMTYYLLPISGIPIVRSSVQPISPDAMLVEKVAQELKTMGAAIKEKCGSADVKHDVPDHFSHLTEELEEYETPQFDPQEETIPKSDDGEPEAYDKYIFAQVLIPSADQEILGTVIGCKHDINGNPIGKSNTNPILETRICQVQLPDGCVEEFSANVIAECIYSQVNNEGNQYAYLIKSLITRQHLIVYQRRSSFKYPPMTIYTRGNLPKGGYYVYSRKMDPKHDNISRT
jgi:hypothetical protein